MANIIVITGNLTREPELKYTPTGTAVCDFSIACNRKYKKDGAMVDAVDYFDVTAFGNTAVSVGEYLEKGSKVLIEGMLRQERWEKDGAKRSKVKINVNRIDFLSSKKHQQKEANGDTAYNDDAPF